MSLKNLISKLTLSAIALSTLSVSLYAGSSAGNGGDIVPPYFYHAWFGGTKKTPRYCYTVSNDFGVTPTELESTLDWAFQQWLDYLKLKHLDGYKVATRLERQSHCDGTEDMRVYFGTTDATVESLKKKYHEPIAFSEKLEYNQYVGWGKGILWLSGPRKFGYSQLDWKKPDALKAILLHEMGHVFGNPHIADTIMDSEMGFKVLGEGGHSGSALNLPLTTIDGGLREMVRCYDCDYEFKCSGHAQLQTRFEKLVGKKVSGHASGTMLLHEGHKKTGVIHLTDNSGTYSFPFEVEKEITWRNGETSAFNVISPPKEEPSNGSIGAGGGGVWFGYMTTPQGKKLPISLSRNLSYGVEVVDLDGPVLTHMEDDSDFFHGHVFKILK